MIDIADTDQQGPRQVIAWQADLVQTHSELDSLQLGVVLAYLTRLAPGAGGHHRAHVADAVVDVTHQRAPPAHVDIRLQVPIGSTLPSLPPSE